MKRWKGGGANPETGPKGRHVPPKAGSQVKQARKQVEVRVDGLGVIRFRDEGEPPPGDITITEAPPGRFRLCLDDQWLYGSIEQAEALTVALMVWLEGRR